MPVRWIELNSHWFIPAGYILKVLPQFPLGVSCTKYPVETHKFQELDRKKTLMCWMRLMRSCKTQFLPGQTEFALECALGFHQNPGDIWGNTQGTTKHDQQFKFSWKVCFSREAHNSLLHLLQLLGAFGFLWPSPAVHILTNKNFPAQGLQSRVTPRTCHGHFRFQSGYTCMKYNTWHVNDIDSLAFW